MKRGILISATALLYINGVSQAFGSASPSGSPNDTAGVWQVGAASGAGLCNGVLDEARISNVVRSGDWIKTEYNNQSSPGTFYGVGGEQMGGGGRRGRLRDDVQLRHPGSPDGREHAAADGDADAVV